MRNAIGQRNGIINHATDLLHRCDSVFQLRLTFRGDSIVDTGRVLACKQYQWRRGTFSLSGSSDNFSTLTSTITHRNDASTTTTQAYAALGDIIYYEDSLQNRIGPASLVHQNGVKCDSIYKLQLRLQADHFLPAQSERYCKTYTWTPVSTRTDGRASASRTFSHSTYTAHGVNDEIIYGNFNVTDTTIYDSVANAVERINSIKHQSIAGIAGGVAPRCDSIYTLNLRLRGDSSKTELPVLACKTYEWKSSNSTYDQNTSLYPNVKTNHTQRFTLNTYHDLYGGVAVSHNTDTTISDTVYNSILQHGFNTMNASIRCDSVYLQHLRVRGDTAEHDQTVVACKFYLWSDNGGAADKGYALTTKMTDFYTTYGYCGSSKP